MKNILTMLVLGIVFASGTVGYCAGYCYTEDELIKKIEANPIKAQTTEFKTELLSSCTNYIKTTPKPNCDLASDSIMLLYNSLYATDKVAANKYIQELNSAIKTKCPDHYDSFVEFQQMMRIMIDQYIKVPSKL